MVFIHHSLRIISVVVLSFFLWTFGGFFDIAYAIKNDTEHSSKGNEPKAKKPEETFEESLEKIRDAEDKAHKKLEKGEDTEDEEKEIKNKRKDLDKADLDIKKQFKETEDKIKGLPGEIRQRHRDFVKKYEENFNELKANLDEIEKTRTKGEKERAHGKTKEFLEKTKPPKKHKPLDPNKLPHRTPEVEQREPRTNPEQFTEGKELRAKSIEQKPILVASNGPLKGLINEPQTPPLSSPYQGEAGRGNTSSNLLALANPPTTADLAETIEVQFTPEIRAKAQELGNDPVKIYNWVRNNIEYVPTYGSIQGANHCLQTKLCNDFDTASLLIALLRTSGIHARYAYGTIEVPIEKVKNWAGGFTDSMAAINLLASAGVPTKGMIVGGEVKYVRMEHMFVEAWIDYIPSRGARHKVGDTWIPLDASFKQYNYTQGIDIKTAVPFDAQTFVDQIKNSATINEAQGYVTNVNSLLIQQTMQDYQTRMQNYISQNHPNATVGDVLGKKEIVKQEFPILLGTLPYNDIVVGWKNSSLPDNLRHKITFNVTKDMYDEFLGTPINITKSLPELAGKKITLSYSPATAQDEAAINSFLPKPHADGTPIQPSELPSSLPAYLINLKPEIRLDGVVVATGTPIGMGINETFTMTFSGPERNANDVITNPVKAGNYLGIALDLGKISQEQMIALKTKLEATKAKLDAQDFGTISKEDILGDLLYTTALFYHAELEGMNYVTARGMGVLVIILPSETIFSCELKSNYTFGIPISVSSGGLAMDADRLMNLVKALDADTEKPKQFLLALGMNGSALEHLVPQQIWSTTDNIAQGISAVKALQIANDQGIPVYTINQANMNSILPQLELDSGTISDIHNAVNAGKEVTVSRTNINFNGWNGCGYIIIDPATGAGAYMINGGLNGGLLMYKFAWVFLFLAYLDLASCFLGMIIMCAFAAVFAVIAMAYMNAAICMLTSVNYQPDGFMNQLAFGASIPLFYAAANAILIAAAKRVPGGSTMKNVFLVNLTAKLTDIVAGLLGIVCSKKL